MAKELSGNASNFERVTSFLKSQVSRVVSPPPPDDIVSQRVKSCFGDNTLSPCEHLKLSGKNPGNHYCGFCGCGERKILELVIPKIPYLECPKGASGFNVPESLLRKANKG